MNEENKKVCEVVTAGDCDTATTERWYSTAIAGRNATATAGDYGTAITRDASTSTAGYCGTAIAGEGSTATVGDKGTATAGEDGAASAGDKSEIRIRYFDNIKSRYRTKTGYIGEAGLEANVLYKLNANHEFVRV